VACSSISVDKAPLLNVISTMATILKKWTESKHDLEFVIPGQTPSSPSKFAMSCKNAWSSRIHDMEMYRLSFKKNDYSLESAKVTFVPVVLIWYHKTPVPPK